jgi:hypothetical protein
VLVAADLAQVGPGRVRRRIQLDAAPERLLGVGGPPGARERDTEVEVGGGPRRPGLDRVAERVERWADPAQLEQAEGEVGVDLRVARQSGGGDAQRLLGVGRAPAAQEEGAEQGVGLGVARLSIEDRPAGGLRARDVAGLKLAARDLDLLGSVRQRPKDNVAGGTRVSLR